jgi:hypothetical protein
MKISILTTIGNEKFSPDDRQDKWIEALYCFSELADQVIVVNGNRFFLIKQKLERGRVYYSGEYSTPVTSKIIDQCFFLNFSWPYEWNWVELPRHLNAGLEKCSGDFVIKMDIDQLFHEDDFRKVRQKLAECPQHCDVATFQKMSLTYGKKYYQKGGQPIAFRNKPYIRIGKDMDKETDLCFPVDMRHGRYEKVGDYRLPVGRGLDRFKTGVTYWNLDYFFKTKEFTRKEFWRFSRAYHRYFDKWSFGETEEESFRKFLGMMKGRHDRAPYTYKLGDLPKYIRGAVRDLKKEQFGFNAWGLI